MLYPVLPFLAFSVLPRKNLKFAKDFLSLPNPQNPWKRQRKYQDNQGNSLLKINQGNPKNQGMEGQGIFKIRVLRASEHWIGCCERTVARKTPATSHGVGSWRGVDQELANFWATLCTNLALAISGCFSATKSAHKIGLARSAQNRAGQKLTKSWTWVANFWHEHSHVEIAGVFLAVVLWQHPNKTASDVRHIVLWRRLK